MVCVPNVIPMSTRQIPVPTASSVWTEGKFVVESNANIAKTMLIVALGNSVSNRPHQMRRARAAIVIQMSQPVLTDARRCRQYAVFKMMKRSVQDVFPTGNVAKLDAASQVAALVAY